MTGSCAPAFRLCMFMIAISAGAKALAQDTLSTGGLTEDPEEEVLELIDDDEASESVADLIASLREDPLDLNLAGREDLLLIPGIAEEDADAILRLRASKGALNSREGALNTREGAFKSLEEILVLPRGRYLLARLRPYVVLRRPRGAPASVRRPAVLVTSRLSHSTKTGSASSAGDLLGGNSRVLTRATVSLSHHLNIGTLFEKDAGERAHDGFVSGYLLFHGVGPIERLVFGDFTPGAGQGLVLWRTADFGKGGDIAGGGRRSGSGLQPYRQADEAHFLRGGALVLKGALFRVPVRCMLLLSRTSLAANVDEEGSVTSFYTAGLYRTKRELEKVGAVRESLTGGRLEGVLRNRATIGLTYYQSRFDRAIRPSSGYGFSGEICRVGGADFGLVLGPVRLFGEAARTAQGGTAWILGGVITADSTLRISLSFRDYATDFANPHARGFGIQSNTSNERGTYVGWSLRVSSTVLLRGYAEHCRIPGSSYTSLLPRSSSDLLWGAAVTSGSKAHFSFSMRIRRQEAMASGRQCDRRRRSVLVTGKMELSRHFETRTRIERAWFGISGQGVEQNSNPGTSGTQGANGILGSQRFRYYGTPIECEYGIAIFDADSYDARLYDVEGNLRGAVTSPGLHGRGMRWYLLASWSWWGLRVAGKYTVTSVERNEQVREGALHLELRL